MSRNKLISSAVGIVLFIVIAAGFFVPVGSYTSQNSCLASETSHVLKQRLTIISGQDLQQVKLAASQTKGCVLPIKYTLFVL